MADGHKKSIPWNHADSKELLYSGGNFHAAQLFYQLKIFQRVRVVEIVEDVKVFTAEGIATVNTC